jgi:phage terminase small subunit
VTHRGRKNVYDFVPVAGEPEGATAKPARNSTEPPPHLSQAMQGWWRQVVAEYDLEAHQLHLLEQACNAWDRCEEARLAIAEHGLTYEGPHGPRPRPEVVIERDARIAFARLVRELNLELPPAYNEIGHRTR